MGNILCYLGGDVVNNIVKKAVIKSINQEFDIPIYAEESFDHGDENCFFVEVIKTEEKRMLNNCRERVLTFEIDYFPLDACVGQEDFLGVVDILYEILDIVGYGNDRFMAYDMSHKIEDNTLKFTVSYKFRLILERDIDLMERLEKYEGNVG